MNKGLMLAAAALLALAANNANAQDTFDSTTLVTGGSEYTGAAEPGAIAPPVYINDDEGTVPVMGGGAGMAPGEPIYSDPEPTPEPVDSTQFVVPYEE